MSDGTEVLVRDLDQALALGGQVYYPHRVDILGDAADFAMRLRSVLLGPLLVGSLGYDVEVRIETTAPLGTSYEVNVPMSGQLESWVDGRSVLGDPATAIVTPPSSTSVLRGFGRGRPLLGLKIDRTALDTHYRALWGPAHDLPRALPPTIDLRHNPGRQWWMLASALREHLTETSPLAHPLVSRPLAESVLSGLLLAWLGDPGQTPARPAAIDNAIEYIQAHAAEPITVAQIARAAGCSVRALQQGFAGHLGSTPIGYLRSVRLACAHADLTTADPAHTSVTDVSWRWGFTHPGRFAATYRAEYGQHPSRTLRA
ncbi:MAG TPA: AraC family transcriptional regulator [Pseudonocardia sp.]|jgi:AraC-like DNA-binding protein|nr:AraC family transcriptional regulator [Pseudonocardia sp.]